MALRNQTNRRPEYSDLDLDFIPHTTIKNVVKNTGLEAIKMSVRNLVFTNFYDRPFRPFIGSNAQKILFDNINPLTATFLRNAIMEVIQNFEPRVKLSDDPNLGVVVNVDPDNNGYNVQINFTIVNRGEPAVINLFLERLR